jgi:hypothetical protein
MSSPSRHDLSRRPDANARRRRAQLAGFAVIAILGVASCNKSGGDVSDEPAASYTVRGKVIELPGAEIETMAIHHEAIPNFVAATGKQQPMMAMEMPFGLAEGLDLSGIEPGDIVELRFDVDFERRPPLRIVEIRELPADTELAI